MTEPIQHVEDLIHSELEFLAQLLSHTPHEEISPFWLQDQSTLLETFPLSLLKPHFVLDRIEASLPFAPEKACLCPSHKPLNAVLIRRLYNELREECTTHLKRFDEVTFLPSRIAAVVKRLKTVRSLWMNADEYRATARPKPEDARYDEVGRNDAGHMQRFYLWWRHGSSGQESTRRLGRKVDGWGGKSTYSEESYKNRGGPLEDERRRLKRGMEVEVGRLSTSHWIVLTRKEETTRGQRPSTRRNWQMRLRSLRATSKTFTLPSGNRLFGIRPLEPSRE
jgi:hypothetical protein